MFFVTALLTSVGAVSPGAVAIVAPIALRFSQQHRIHPLLMGLMVLHGAQGGGFSPMSIYGGITNQVVQRADLAGNDMHLFLASLGFNLLVAVVVFFVFGGRSLLAQRAVESRLLKRSTRPVERGRQRTHLPAGTDAPRFDLARRRRAGAELNGGRGDHHCSDADDPVPQGSGARGRQIHWSTVLLICGVVTYIAVPEKDGAVTFVGDSVSSIGAPLVGALLLCYVGGVVSAFASTVGVLGAIIPLAVPLLLLGQSMP